MVMESQVGDLRGTEVEEGEMMGQTIPLTAGCYFEVDPETHFDDGADYYRVEELG